MGADDLASDGLRDKVPFLDAAVTGSPWRMVDVAVGVTTVLYTSI